MTDFVALSASFPLVLPGCRDVVFFGAFLDTPWGRVSVGGAGFTAAHAGRACNGEAAEGIALCRHPNDPRVTDRGTVKGKLSGGATVEIAASEVLRDDHACGATSTGMGAGRTLEDAVAHAALEISERACVADWWRGYIAGYALDLAIVRAAMPLGTSPFQAVRGQTPPRFVVLEHGNGSVVVVALSEHRDSGRLAFGAKAAADMGRAISGAYLELRQAELAVFMAIARGETPDGASVDALPHIGRKYRNSDSIGNLPDRKNWPVATVDLSMPHVPLRVARMIIIGGNQPDLGETEALETLYGAMARPLTAVAVSTTNG